MSFNKAVSFVMTNIRYITCKWIDTIFCMKFWIKHPRLFVIDVLMCLRFFFRSPYRVYTLFFNFRMGDAKPVPYGETPIKTWVSILNKIGVSEKHVLVDLGSGRGRLIFWASCLYGCESFGLELVSAFSTFASWARSKLGLDKAHFINCDFFNISIPNGDFIYCYCTGWDEDTLSDLAIWLCRVPNNPVIVTVSGSISDYMDSFELLDSFDADFGWGTATVYVQKLKIVH